MPRKKIVFVIDHLCHVGGAEASMVKLMSHLVGATPFGISVVCLMNLPLNRQAYDLPNTVRCVNLEDTDWKCRWAAGIGRWLPHAWASRLQARVRRDRGTLLAAHLQRERASLVVSFMPFPIMASAAAVRRWPVPHIASHRSNPFLHRFYRQHAEVLGPACREATANVVLHEAFASFFADAPAVHVIPNGVQVPEAIDRPPLEARAPVIIAIGRMVAHKNHELLIRGFAQVAAEHPGWELHIYGETREQAALQALVAKHTLEGRVRLFAPVTDILAKLSQARIFASGSRMEGWPRAFCEAMLCELPTVSLRECVPTNEFVRLSASGILVDDDPAAVAAAFRHLIDDPQAAARMGRAGRAYIEPFDEDHSHRQWQALIERTLDRAPAAAGRARQRGAAVETAVEA
jgi:glycosyltransferase involved in cell wall biosynthesis